MTNEKVAVGGWTSGDDESERLPASGAPRGERVLVTRVGLHCPRQLAFGEWERAGRKLARVVDSSAWCLGDWLLYGQTHYVDRYRRAIDATGLDYGTLRNYASVARRIPLSRRRDALTFQHHVEVAALPGDEQEIWLDKAEKRGWSRNQLRHRLSLSRGKGKRSGRSHTSVRRLSFQADLVDRWREAAERSGRDMEDWIIATLDSAVEEIDKEAVRAAN